MRRSTGCSCWAVQSWCNGFAFLGKILIDARWRAASIFFEKNPNDDLLIPFNLSFETMRSELRSSCLFRSNVFIFHTQHFSCQNSSRFLFRSRRELSKEKKETSFLTRIDSYEQTISSSCERFARFLFASTQPKVRIRVEPLVVTFLSRSTYCGRPAGMPAKATL